MKMMLSGTDWTLTGWVRHQWQFYKKTESGGFALPIVPEIKASVPGSVQTDLYAAHMIQDWNHDLNFFNQEWIERREWAYEKQFSIQKNSDISKYILTFEGIDFSGYVFLNGIEILYFDQMHLPYEIDVTKHLIFEGDNILRVVFLQVPEVDGQVGYTSRTTVLKSRFNYGWDWSPRMVNIGIFRDVYLRGVETAYFSDMYPKAFTENQNGILTVTSDIISMEDASMQLQYTVLHGDCVCYSEIQNIFVQSEKKNPIVFTIKLDNIELWYPNGYGQQELYTVQVSLIHDCVTVDSCQKRVGFRKLEYKLPKDADLNHYPYSITVNDSWIFIKGVNWVPISPFYGSVTEEQYRYYLGQLRCMNVNLIRVWGGALLESEVFYNICDEMGFLVWQEFPQSSSGIDNAPCEDPKFIKLLAEVAREYVVGRRHHVSLTMWCAGNELYDVSNVPISEDHPNIAALKEIVSELDNNRLFLPDSPSGKVASWSVEYLGEKVCGDTHGPWTYLGPQKHYMQFNIDDSLLHSEVGAPACPRLETLQKYCSGLLWPPSFENPFWRNRGSWWLYDKQLDDLFGRFDGEVKGIAEYVKAFRYIQMEAVRYAASAIRRAGQKKAGVIIWMANEPFPNSANTSILEFDGCPKPIFYKLKNVYSEAFVGLAYSTPALHSDNNTEVVLFGSSDKCFTAKHIKVSVFDIYGNMLREYNIGDVEIPYTVDIARLELPVTAPLIIVRITADIGFDFCEEYVFTIDGETPFGALLDMKKVKLIIKKVTDRHFTLTNADDVAALFVDCIGKNKKGRPLVVNNSYRCLLPKETISLITDDACEEITVFPMNSSL